MNKNRFFGLLVVGVALGITTPAVSHAQSAPVPASAPHQTATDLHGTALPDYFSGLTYNEDQQQQIDKIRKDTAARKDVIIKDPQLSSDQKDALLLGYNRIEYGSIFKVLTPEQQRQVRKRLQARRAQEAAAKQKKPLQGPSN